MILIGLVLIANSILIAKCVQWHARFSSGTKLLKKLRQQIGSKESDSRSILATAVQWAWERASVVGFFFVPLLLIVLHGSGDRPFVFGSYLLLGVWLLTPFGELCSIMNRCEILDLRILNSELELLRNCYVNKTTTN